MEMVIDRLNMLLHKFQKRVLNPMLAGSRQKKLKYRDFTIISNNCWGGGSAMNILEWRNNLQQ